MSQRVLLLASLMAPLLTAQQEIRRPSPFPEKNRERKAAVADTMKSKSLHAGSAHRDSVPASRSIQSAIAGEKERGKAAYFRSGGSLTARGERVDATDLIAAHAAFPLGSFVKVTNVRNGKTVEVQIVDRFPVSERIINVSEATARQLGFIEAGTADVELEPTSPRPARSTATQPAR